MFWRKWLLGIMVLGLYASQAEASDIVAIIIYQSATKFDKSFNEAAFGGVSRFRKETNQKVVEYTVPFRDDLFMMMESYIQEKEPSLVIGVGFSQIEAITKAATLFPKVHFTLIDAYTIDLPNLRQYSFHEHEGSYLVGLAATLASKTNKIGFIGGMDVPLIRKFECGYIGGAKSINPAVKIESWMIGNTPQAWNSPVRAAEITKKMLKEGVDVVFAAAGGSGLGVITEINKTDKWVIGVDSNQNYLAPNRMITSMVKRVDEAVYNSLMDDYHHKFTGGRVALGLKEKGIGWSEDEYNQTTLTQPMREAMKHVYDDIVSGNIVVHNFEDDKQCPYK